MSATYDFMRLVARMRHAQKMYFKTHTGSSLLQAKRLEDSVDRQLEEFGFMNQKASQIEMTLTAEKKHSEEAAVYDVGHDGEQEPKSAA